MKDEMWILGLEAAPNQLFRILRFEKATHDIGMVLPVWNASLPTLEHRTDCGTKVYERVARILAQGTSELIEGGLSATVVLMVKICRKADHRRILQVPAPLLPSRYRRHAL